MNFYMNFCMVFACLVSGLVFGLGLHLFSPHNVLGYLQPIIFTKIKLGYKFWVGGT